MLKTYIKKNKILLDNSCTELMIKPSHVKILLDNSCTELMIKPSHVVLHSAFIHLQTSNMIFSLSHTVHLGFAYQSYL